MTARTNFSMPALRRSVSPATRVLSLVEQLRAQPVRADVMSNSTDALPVERRAGQQRRRERAEVESRRFRLVVQLDEVVLLDGRVGVRPEPDRSVGKHSPA